LGASFIVFRAMHVLLAVSQTLAGRFSRAMHVLKPGGQSVSEPAEALHTQRNFFHKPCPDQPWDKAGINKHSSSPGIIGIDV